MKYIIITAIIIGVLAFSVWLSYQVRPDEVAERHIATQRVALDRVPTIKQLQQAVGAKPDGIVGPNTISLWKKAINTQYAVESIERMATGDKK